MKATLIVAAAAASIPLAASAQGTYPNTGRDLAASCAICHGTNGVNAGGMPNLAGQPASYLVMQLRDFRDGKRPATIMHQIAKGLTEDQIQAVSAYWSGQKPK
jgi:cytochrome c553